MKFKYADVVEVTEGFYGGQKGIVNSCYEKYIGFFWNTTPANEYGIHLSDNYIVVPEQYLKLLKREENNGSSKPN